MNKKPMILFISLIMIAFFISTSLMAASFFLKPKNKSVIARTPIIVSSNGSNGEDASEKISSSSQSIGETSSKTGSSSGLKPKEQITDEGDGTFGTTYYVDALTGDDSSDGKSYLTAFKTLDKVNLMNLTPGDRVLFKKGGIWNGQIIVKNSGTKDNPIIYGMYGTGENNPIINGNGTVRTVIGGTDVSFIEIRNFEVTNFSEDEEYKRGIGFTAIKKVVEGIKIIGCYVHDVNSLTSKIPAVGTRFDFHWFGGIIVKARNESDLDNGNIIVKDILIEGNRVDRCDSTGIAAGGAASTGGVKDKCTGMRIRNNYVSNCYGDGIILFNDNNGYIEYNVAANNGAAKRLDRAFVGIWNIWGRNDVIQYNESYGMPQGADGMGFDIDGGCHNTILQYNYSNDNYRGFLNLVQGANGRATVRFNISQNDQMSFIWIAVANTAEPFCNVDIYNNTFYTNKEIESAVVFHPGSGALIKNIYAYFKNNIFYIKKNSQKKVVSEKWEDFFRWENNCYFGFLEENLPQREIKKIFLDPCLVAPGSGMNGLDTVNGYKLLKGSPLLGKGVSISNNGGLDFFGNPAGPGVPVNVGAYNGTGENVDKSVNVALSKTVTASSVKALSFLRSVTIAKLTDGNLTEAISTDSSRTVNHTEWFEIDLERILELEKVILRPEENGTAFPKDFKISVFNDTEWVDVVVKSNYPQPQNGQPQEFKFNPIKGSKIRLTATGLRKDDSGDYVMMLSEIEAYQ